MPETIHLQHLGAALFGCFSELQIAHLHGHCHQKAFAAMGPVETVLRSVPGLELKVIESSCCGMSGAFGYAAEHIELSRKMAELSQS
ncbi:hypothetical protein [Paracoccus mutanolyticus]|uniref:hypothetical protein n=1 Tax=Paracoccus mutanolyticus TaxID=1499308 RepID=UPI001CB9767E|nr:hypothetical protein [Paracoccus mutanolyticus]